MAQKIEETERAVSGQHFPPERYEQAKEALKRLVELTRDMPSTDAVALVREGRELLADRTANDGN